MNQLLERRIYEAPLPLYVSLPYIEKYHVQDSNLILSTDGATHSCEYLHHLTDGHGKAVIGFAPMTSNAL